MIIWFIGLSGAGKTTLSRALYDRLKPGTRHLVHLDGDDFRDMFRNDVDHTVEGRRKNAERISHTCRMLDAENIHVIASVLSLFPEWQAWNRETFGRYYEVFLDVPLSTLKERDTKGIYAAAERGDMPNVVGIDIPFPRPAQADLIIDEEQQRAGIDACIETVLARMPALD